MMTTPRLRLALPALLVACTAAGQAPATATKESPTPKKSAAPKQNGVPNQEALALRVTKAHQPGGTIPSIEAFTSKIELELKDVTAEQGGQATLDVQFMELKEPGRKRTTTLLRYEAKGAEERIVRGFDLYGPWHLHNGKPQDLTAPNATQDYKHFKEHRNLARQIVRFLTPGNVIRALNNATPVTERKLKLGRKATNALAIEGDVDRFPLMHQGGEESQAHLTIWIDKKTNHLLAVDVTPIDKATNKQQPQRRERITMQKLQNRNGLLTPKYLHYLVPGKRGQLRIHSTVHLINLDLRPTLTTGDFNRK